MHIQNERPDFDLIHLADGTQDNWDFFDEQLLLGFQLVDFYHASEYLKQAFNAAYLNDKNKAKSQYDKYYLTFRSKFLRTTFSNQFVVKTINIFKYISATLQLI